MAETTEPIIKLEEGGQASVISYNVPEPTSYTGRNFIELSLEKSDFLPVALEVPEDDSTGTGSTGGGFHYGDFHGHLEPLDVDSIAGIGTRSMARKSADKKGGIGAGAANPEAPAKTAAASAQTPAMSLMKGKAQVNWYKEPSGGYRVDSTVPISTRMKKATPEQTLIAQQESLVPVTYKNLYGTYDVVYVPQPTQPDPRIVLVETYRLSSYLGNYGAGRTIKTYSLFPGEKASISVKTYKQTESEEASASSILDSFTETSADEFESSVASEQSDSETYEKAKNYSVEADAHASWGWGSVNVSGSYSGSSQSAREEFAKNISSATEKHAATASAKRDVQIDTSYKVKETAGEETSIVREFQNINVSRTLNFVFRQMNQEFITILHLVDVRVAFVNGFAEKTKEVALPELDSLLETYVVAARRGDVRQQILGGVSNIFDYRDDPHTFIEERELTDTHGNKFQYYRVKKYYTSEYRNEATGTTITVPGIILSADNYVLRTDGVIVEALLGQAPALDAYSQTLQDQTVRAKELENYRLAAELDKTRAALAIVRNKDAEAAAIYQQVFPVTPVDTDSDEA